MRAVVFHGIRDLREFVLHHRLDVDAIVGSRAHGFVKPHPTIFQAASIPRLTYVPAVTVAPFIYQT